MVLEIQCGFLFFILHTFVLWVFSILSVFSFKMEKDRTSLHNVGDEKQFDSTSTSNNGDTTVPVTPENAENTETPENTEDVEPVYPKGLPFWLITISLCLAVFVLAIGAFPLLTYSRRGLTSTKTILSSPQPSQRLPIDLTPLMMSLGMQARIYSRLDAFNFSSVDCIRPSPPNGFSLQPFRSSSSVP